MNQAAKFLRDYNAWRRGADALPPASRDLGNAIERAIEIIEQHDRLVEAVMLTLAENADDSALHRLKDVIEGCV